MKNWLGRWGIGLLGGAPLVVWPLNLCEASPGQPAALDDAPLEAVILAQTDGATAPGRGTGAPNPASSNVPDLGAGLCGREQVGGLIRNLDRWMRQFQEGESRLAAQLRCDLPEVVCLDRFGQPRSDALPARVQAGRPFSVHVLFPSADAGRLTLSTAYGSHIAQAVSPIADEAGSRAPGVVNEIEAACTLTSSDREAVQKAVVPIAKLASRPGLESLEIPADSWGEHYWSVMTDAKIVTEWSAWLDLQRRRRMPTFTSIGSRLEVPAGDVVNVDFVRTERGATAPATELHHELPIDNGRYYLELAVLVPFVYKGQRNVELVPVAGTADLRLGIEEDWHVTAAAMVQYFPFGRQRGQTLSFHNCRWKSCVDNWLGMQFGVGFTHPLQEWYLGLVVEPVAGFNLGVGASFLMGDFLANGRAEGMVLPSSSENVSNRQYMFRPYLGFSFTLDIVETIDRALHPFRTTR